MKISKNLFLEILQQEAGQVLAEEITSQQLEKIANKIISKLDSIDMSMDLVYGALIGTGQASIATRASQRALGRAMVPGAIQTPKVNELFGLGKKAKREKEIGSVVSGFAKAAAADAATKAAVDKMFAAPKKDSEKDKDQLEKDAPVSLFKGQGSLYQGLYNSLADTVGAKSKRDKNDVEQVVKLIMKDLSAQLRYNKIKVQENQLIEAPTHALAEIVRTPSAASQSMEIYKAKFKQIQKLRKKYKDNPKKLRTLDMDEKAMKNAYAEFKKSFKAGGAATDITSKSQRRVTPEKGVLQVGKAAAGKLKGWKGGVLDQKTITKLIVKNIKPFIVKSLKDRGIEGIKIKENKNLDSIIEEIINEM